MKSCNSLSESAATMMHHAVVNRGHGPGPNSSERSDGPAGPGSSGCEVSGSEAAGRMERGGPAPGPARPGDGVRRAADGARRVALLPQAGRQRGGQKLRRGGPGGGKGLRRWRRQGGGAVRSPAQQPLSGPGNGTRPIKAPVTRKAYAHPLIVWLLYDSCKWL